MSTYNHTDALNSEQLRQEIISRISQCDDAQVLSKCLHALTTALEGDEIVETMAVTGQLRQTHSDKEQLARQALNAQNADTTDNTFMGHHDDDDDDDDDTAPHTARRSWRKPLMTGAALAILALAGYAVHQLIEQNRNKEKPLVTVARQYETVEVNGCQFNMVVVPGGTFTMGATAEQGDNVDSDERPTQEVTLSTFRIGETEVTQQLWQAVMGYGPASPDGPRHPMKDVSWDECQQFVAKLNELTGRRFHLPTEAQWEFAARGGNLSHHTIYPGSNDIDAVGWYSANAWDQGKDSPDFGNHPVGTREPNELGLYDMAGNVWEWCLDSYAKYDGQPKTDPQGPTNASGSYRVNRGGSWDYIATSARLSNRRNRTPDFRNFNLGLRLAEDGER